MNLQEAIIWFFVIFFAEIVAESLLHVLHEFGVYKSLIKFLKKKKPKKVYRRRSAKVLPLREVK